jgi:regulator of protease activity HflC (stomatin/prohibitin superfamily)
VDRTAKKALYQDVFRTPEYFWFSPETGELAGFHLVDGHYQPIQPDAQGRLGSTILGLRLGVVDGSLRLFDTTGTLVPTLPEAIACEQARVAEEQAQAERQREQTEQARAQAERERARADRLAERLRALGVDPAED